jgi:hypothetical protein
VHGGHHAVTCDARRVAWFDGRLVACRVHQSLRTPSHCAAAAGQRVHARRPDAACHGVPRRVCCARATGARARPCGAGHRSARRRGRAGTTTADGTSGSGGTTDIRRRRVAFCAIRNCCAQQPTNRWGAPILLRPPAHYSVLIFVRCAHTQMRDRRIRRPGALKTRGDHAFYMQVDRLRPTLISPHANFVWQQQQAARQILQHEFLRFRGFIEPL